MNSRTTSSAALHQRLLPLYFATFLQGVWLWVPVEKLFMNQIGFDAAAVGLMAAVYAAVPPLAEVPSGVLADRWSRRGVLVVASFAAMVSVLVGGLSTSVPMYFVSALFLGVYFAMRSGTVEAVVYDTVIEMSGNSEQYEKKVGRVRMIESAALVSSALAGGLLAEATSARLMYFLTIPFTALSIVALLRFREPRLHEADEQTSLRRHLRVTYQTLTRRGQLRAVIALAVLTSLVMTTIFEFGPLWLLALGAAAAFYGPHWAGLMSTFGLGGMLAGRLRFDRGTTVAPVSAVVVFASLVLTTSRSILVVTLAQIVLVLLMMAASIHITRLMHDAVPSAIRAGVASGVGAVSWIVFLPFAVGFGFVSQTYGVEAAGWMVVAVSVLVSGLMLRVALRGRSLAHAAAELEPVAGCGEALRTPVAEAVA
ncbi:MAG TPA: MFS transporter [Nocardioidaceae bacterium]|nr:MFS transporter [Nocardioidaceae bacterium]